MALLASLLTGLFGGLVDFLARFVTRKIALTAAFVAVFIALTAGFASAVGAVASGLVPSIPAWLAIPLTWAVPSNITACISALIAGRVARWLYVNNVRIAQLKL